MLKFKNYILLKSIQFKFLSYVKPKKKYKLNLISYHTTRILANRAPKHFNIGQHAMKVRVYKGEKHYFLNKTYLGTAPQFITPSYAYLNVNLSKNITIRRICLYYVATFRYN